MSDAAKTYAALQQKLEALWQAGQGESEEADALRDEMDGPWYAMTAAEHEAFRNRVRHNGE